MVEHKARSKMPIEKTAVSAHLPTNQLASLVQRERQTDSTQITAHVLQFILTLLLITAYLNRLTFSSD
jgi:hypothetical protein